MIESGPLGDDAYNDWYKKKIKEMLTSQIKNQMKTEALQIKNVFIPALRKGKYFLILFIVFI